jgi:hypothetical protein
MAMRHERRCGCSSENVTKNDEKAYKTSTKRTWYAKNTGKTAFLQNATPPKPMPKRRVLPAIIRGCDPHDVASNIFSFSPAVLAASA